MFTWTVDNELFLYDKYLTVIVNHSNNRDEQHLNLSLSEMTHATIVVVFADSYVCVFIYQLSNAVEVEKYNQDGGPISANLHRGKTLASELSNSATTWVKFVTNVDVQFELIEYA